MIGLLIGVSRVVTRRHVNEIGSVSVTVVGVARLSRWNVNVKSRFEERRTSVLVFRRLRPKPVRQWPRFGRRHVVAQGEGLVLKRGMLFRRRCSRVGRGTAKTRRGSEAAGTVARPRPAVGLRRVGLLNRRLVEIADASEEVVAAKQVVEHRILANAWGNCDGRNIEVEMLTGKEEEE